MAKNIFPNKNSLRVEYEKNFPIRAFIAKELETRIEKLLSHMSSHPRVKYRIKDFESYFKKYIRILKSGASNKSLLIADVIGIRIICPFLEDLAAVEELLKGKFKVIEVERKGGDHTFREFGYESIHLHIAVPDDIVPSDLMLKRNLSAEKLRKSRFGLFCKMPGRKLSMSWYIRPNSLRSIIRENENWPR